MNFITNRRDIGQVFGSLFGAISRNYKRNIPFIPLLTFKLNKSGSFTGSFSTVGGTVLIDLGTGVVRLSNNPTYSYPNGSLKKVVIYKGTSDATKITAIDFSSLNISGIIDCSKLTNVVNFRVYSNAGITGIKNPINSQVIQAYLAYSCNLTGTLDLSSFSNLAGGIILGSNPNLTAVIFPSSNQVITISIAVCNLTGILNLSPLSKLSGGFYAYQNSNLTSISNPTSSQVFTAYQAYSCNLTGTLDLSTLTGLGGDIRLYSNPNLTGIILPNSSQNIGPFMAYSCNLTGTLDMSGLTNLSGTLQINNNANMTGLLLPTINQGFLNFSALNCALNQSSIDNIFSKLNTWYSSHSPTSNLTVTLAGGTNAVPTGGANNTDILSLTSIFFNAGRVFSYSINI